MLVVMAHDYCMIGVGNSEGGEPHCNGKSGRVTGE